jgi:hypothetical protein
MTRIAGLALLAAVACAWPAQATFAQAGAQRSAQGDCVREVERRGFTVTSTGNFQQSRDGWQLDVTARDQRGRVTNGTCFVTTRTGDVSLYGFGWGGGDSGPPDGFEFVCASKDERYRECQLPVDGRARLVRRKSDAPCVEGRSWGQRADRVWVDYGCRAVFAVVRGGTGGGNQGQQQRAEVQCRNEAERQYIQVRSVAPARKHGSHWETVVDGKLRGQSVRADCRFYPSANRAELSFGGFGGSGGSGGSGGAMTAERECVDEAGRQGLHVVSRQAARPIAGGYGMQLSVRRKNGSPVPAYCTYRFSSGRAELRY